MEVYINNWSVVESPDLDGYDPRYAVPEMRVLRLRGEVKNHPDYPDGEIVMSSGIASVNGRKVTVRSGKTYVLLEPDPSYVEYCVKNNMHNPIDTVNPIKVKGNK